MKRLIPLFLSLFLLVGCNSTTVQTTPTNLTPTQTETQESFANQTASTPSVALSDTTEMDLSFDEIKESTSQKQPTDIGKVPTEAPQQENAALPETLTIQKGGSYRLTGEKKDAMITINAGEEEVFLTLSGVTVTNSKGPALFVQSAKKVTLLLEEGTKNQLSDGSSYAITVENSTLDAALFSRSDITIAGKGTLVVQGNYKHGIVSKDELEIASGILQVTAKKVAIEGKDCVKINGGIFTVRAGSDGIRSSNNEDPNKGFVYIHGGSVAIQAGNDGIQAQTLLQMEKGTLTLTCGGGINATASLEGSFKGLKAGTDIRLHQGTFVINSLDDCIHANGTVTLNGGTYTLSSGKDALRATTDLAITGGTFTVTKCEDGIQATNIIISGGNTTITTAQSGIQAKGAYHQTGGTVTLFANGSNNKAVLTFASSAIVEKATLMAFGNSAKQTQITQAKEQCSLLLTFPSQKANCSFVLKNNEKTVASLTPAHPYSVALICTPKCTTGNYTLTTGTFTKSFAVTTTLYSFS